MSGHRQTQLTESGDSLPWNPAPRAGRQFLLTEDTPTHLKGFYLYDGVKWISKPNSSEGIGGWNDYLAPGIQLETGSPSTAPVLRQLRDGIMMYAFDPIQMNQAWSSIHILHDYIPGTNLFPHIHWTCNNASPSGTVRWGIEYTLAQGYDLGAFGATQTIILEPSVGNQYSHHITETLDIDSIDGSNIDHDTVVLFRIFRDGLHANDTFADDAFLLYMDFHYQSDGSLTIERNAPFTKYI